MNHLRDQTRDRRDGEPAPETAFAHLHRADDGSLGALAGRLLDDLVRIIEAEVKLLEVNFGSALTASLDRAVGRLLAVLLGLLGGACLLAALIMLLHEWLRLWLSLAISGAVAIAAGYLVAWLGGRAAKRTESQLIER
jgi:VIT1/CCC1 family predicted Fe2+/Mn2+ transporter